MTASTTRDSNIFETPKEIYDAVKLKFPTATVTFPSSSKMELNIQGILSSPAQIENCLDVHVFTNSLEDLSQNVQLDKLANIQGETYDLNIERSMMMKPLSSWQQFQRIMHEKTDPLCRSAITNYLQNNLGLELLSMLGLAPEQVESTRKEIDLNYFKELPKPLFRLFMQKYPISSKKILDEIVNVSRQQWARTQLSGYQTIYDNLQRSVIGSN